MRKEVATPITSLCISAITEGELLSGLAKRPDARKLHLAVTEFLKRVDVLPWDSRAAKHYGTIRAALESQGNPLAPLDMLIGVLAASIQAVLVTNDRAFGQAGNLVLEGWTQS